MRRSFSCPRLLTIGSSLMTLLRSTALEQRASGRTGRRLPLRTVKPRVPRTAPVVCGPGMTLRPLARIKSGATALCSTSSRVSAVSVSTTIGLPIARLATQVAAAPVPRRRTPSTLASRSRPRHLRRRLRYRRLRQLHRQAQIAARPAFSLCAFMTPQHWRRFRRMERLHAALRAVGALSAQHGPS